MNQEHYLNYAVYMTSHGDYLVKVEPGYFASTAFMKSDAAFLDVAGTKFGGIFGDDGKYGVCSKYNIRRLTSDEEFDKLLESSCREFKFALKCLEEFRHIKDSDKVSIYIAERTFVDETGILKAMLDKFPDLTPEQYIRIYL